MNIQYFNKKAVIGGNDFVSQDTKAFVLLFDKKSHSMLLKLDTPLKSRNTVYTYAIATLRSSNFNIFDSTDSVSCSVTWIPEDKYDSNNPLSLDWWRGGGAAITDIYINLHKLEI